MILIVIMVVITTLLATPVLGSAQEQDPVPLETNSAAAINSSNLGSILTQASKSTEGSLSSGLDLLPSVPCEGVKDAKVAERCTAALFSYYDYYTFGLKHRQKVIWWQHFSSRIIFGIVLSLVVIGVYFAWRQFSAALTHGGNMAELPTSTVEIGSKGVKVSSPILGIIILALSLGFFYLYLVFVYPIVEIL